MSATIEVVRFSVPPERADALISGHPAARLAIDSVSPGWIWSRLARFDERSWIEVVAWSDRDSFDRALKLSVREPDAAEWFDLADPGWTIVLGEVMQASGPIPPTEGSLSLITAPRGDGSALVAAADEGAPWSMLIDLDGSLWREDAWRRAAPGLLRLTVPDPADQPPPSWTESAAIAHSYDAATDGSRAA